MPDMTDDWMDPPNRGGFGFDRAKYEADRRAKPFIIQRAKRRIVSFMGRPPPPDWDTWSAHTTAEERDAELKRLKSPHPMWQLRPRNRDTRGHIREPYGP